MRNNYNFLNSRIAKHLSSHENISRWFGAPIIVSENATKDALNIAATEAYAKQTGQHMFWYYCTDMHSGEVITDPALKHHLQSLSSNNTGH